MSDPIRILIAEDDEQARLALAELLEDEGYETAAVSNGDDAWRLLDSEPFDVALLDIRMPGRDGLTLLRDLRGREDAPSILVMTAYGASSIAIEAMKLGAYDYLAKPLRFDELLIQIDRALTARRQRRQLESYRSEETEEASLVGSSRAMQQVYKLIGQVAPTDSTVLIRGESGTGKELVAREIHRHSKRADGRFVAVNCAAIPASLIEAELFGHEKGAFTGAAQRRIGRFEAAQSGSLFLDEIGELAPETQVKLLRALQERSIERLGSDRPVRLDVRMIAATHVDLEAAVKAGRFREDLYYRLNVVTIPLPALRERRGDIAELAESLRRRISARLDLPAGELTEAALATLRDRLWPGNVRELEHTLERALVLSRGGPITAEHVTKTELAGETDPFGELALDVGFHEWVGRLERRLIQRALEESDGNRAGAARRLGISRRLLYDKIKQLQIEC